MRTQIKTTTYYFPTRIALDQAFCNRKKESERLKANIRSTNPTLIMSPRRFGKTSLVLNVIKKNRMPLVQIDLYKTLSETQIERAILNGVGSLLTQIESTPKKLMKLASDFFSNLHVNILLEHEGTKFSLEIGRRKFSIAGTLLKTLNNLHDLAVQRNKKVILYLDEFGPKVRKLRFRPQDSYF